MKKAMPAGRQGFTMIELVVVIAVFLLVGGSAISIFISIIQQQRAVLQNQELLNQSSYVLEYVGKALRMAKKDASGACLEDDQGIIRYGYNYILTRYDENTQTYYGIKFINASDNDACQEIYLDGTVKEAKNSGAAVDIISEKFQVNSLAFALVGQSEQDNVQPRVTVSLDVQIKGGKSQKFQTTISQRNLDER